jgi:hypothetical protein
MVEHRSALNTVLDINARLAVGPSDRMFAISLLSFDLSVTGEGQVVEVVGDHYSIVREEGAHFVADATQRRLGAFGRTRAIGVGKDEARHAGGAPTPSTR